MGKAKEMATGNGKFNGAFRAKRTECIECGAEFVIDVGEQEFIRSQGWTTLPKRCKPCRAIRKAAGVVRKPKVPHGQ